MEWRGLCGCVCIKNTVRLQVRYDVCENIPTSASEEEEYKAGSGCCRMLSFSHKPSLLYILETSLAPPTLRLLLHSHQTTKYKIMASAADIQAKVGGVADWRLLLIWLNSQVNHYIGQVSRAIERRPWFIYVYHKGR